MNEQTIKKGHTDCLAHSGICIEILDIKISNEKMWQILDGMKTRQVVNLVVLIMTLLGVIMNLIFRFEPTSR